MVTVQTNPIPQRILGFSRDEWTLARFDDPDAATQFLAFFDAVFEAVAAGKGGLAGVGPDAALAIARVSPAFAGRLRNYYDSVDPDWRTNMSKNLSAFISGPEDPRAGSVQSQWAAVLTLLDASTPGS